MEETQVGAPVSVIIPCFRCTNTIDRAIASVWNQSWVPSEVIVVDDCSEDGTLHHLRQIAESYPDEWVRIVASPKNMGPGSARNRGWEAASQPLIAFLDADDAWHREKVWHQATWMLENPGVALTAHACRQIKDEDWEAAAKAAGVSLEPFRAVLRFRLLWRNIFPTRSVMLRRDIALRFLEGKRYSEDFLLWLEIVYENRLRAALSPAPLAFLFKDHFGAGGLSGNVHRMYSGVCENWRLLREREAIGWPLYLAVSAKSYLKHTRRVLIMQAKRAERFFKTQPSNKVLFKHYIKTVASWGFRVLPRRMVVGVRYWLRLGRWPNIKTGERFSEVIQRRKIRACSVSDVVVADKIAVRKYIEEKGFGDTLNELVWVGNRLTKAEFESLPKRFVVKSNNASKTNFVVTDKSKISRLRLNALMLAWRRLQYGALSAERFYDQMPARCLIENYLGSGDNVPEDYKLFVFHGEVAFIVVDLDRFKGHRRKIFDRDWNEAGFSLNLPSDPEPMPKPAGLDRMIALAETVGAGFEFIRVDLYEIAGKIVFGEMTHSPAAGYCRFEPDEKDYEFGRMIERTHLAV